MFIANSLLGLAAEHRLPLLTEIELRARKLSLPRAYTGDRDHSGVVGTNLNSCCPINPGRLNG
jgi:hypothetical protein